MSIFNLVKEDELVGGHENMREARPSFLFRDGIPLLAQARHIGEAAINLRGVWLAVEDANIDLFNATLVEFFLLQYIVSEMICFADHQRTVHHKQRLSGDNGRNTVTVGGRSVAKIKQAV